MKDDVYGAMLWDQFCDPQGKVFEIAERDDGYLFVADAKRLFSRYPEWPQIEKSSLQRATGKILDVGCGTGRHALYLQKLGYDVTGIDHSSKAIKTCRARGLKKAKQLSLRDVGLLAPVQFDTILLLGNNFSFFENERMLSVLLRTLEAITAPHGIIIAGTTDVRRWYRNDSHVSDHTAYVAKNIRRGRMPGQWKIRFRHRALVSSWSDHLFVSKKELMLLLKDTCWKIRKTFETTVSSNANIGNLIIVLEKTTNM